MKKTILLLLVLLLPIVNAKHLCEENPREDERCECKSYNRGTCTVAVPKIPKKEDNSIDINKIITPRWIKLYLYSRGIII